MGQEVIKRVGRRQYRYAIERVVDPASGATRRRWRYLGAVAPVDAEDAGSRLPPTTRDRLLDAFERLLDERPFSGLPISAIGRAAGLAHGTFYRHFHDKDAILNAAIERARGEIELVAPRLDDALGTLEREQARLARWLDALTSLKHERMALIRTWLLHSGGNLAAERRERRRENVTRLASYLEALDEAGLASIGNPSAVARGIYTAIDGTILRRAIFVLEDVNEASIEALHEIVRRAVFGPEGRGARPSGATPRAPSAEA